jgi:transposase
MEEHSMMGSVKRRASKLFYTGLNLEDRVPADHLLRRIASAVSFVSVRERVASCYGYNGQVSIDPVVIVKLMLLAFLENVRSERELMRQLPLRLDWLWFCEMDLDEAAPDHSVLSKARRRWGLEVFEGIFADVLRRCVAAGLVEGQSVYADSTVLKANASVESRVARRLWEQMESGLEPQAGPGDVDDNSSSSDHGHDASPPSLPIAPQPAVIRTPPPKEDTQASQLPPPPVGPFNARTVSTTDPDAATTRRRGRGVTLGYRDHRLVDDRCGIVLATIATPADYDDAALLVPLLDACQDQTGMKPRRAAADSAYGTADNIAELRRRHIKPFLKRRRGRNAAGSWIDAMPPECSPAASLHWLGRRLHRAEGSFADAHTRHDHRRCRWRRRWCVQIQCYLVGTVQNLRKLARRRPVRPKDATPLARLKKITTRFMRSLTPSPQLH